MGGGELEAAGVDGAVRPDRSAGLAAVTVDPESPARGGVRPLGIRFPPERRTPGGGRRLGPAWRWIESMHGWPFRIPQDPMISNCLTAQRPATTNVTPKSW